MSRNEPSAHELARLVDRAAGDFPPHEPQGRARLSQARRAADAKWKRRARDRRALPLLGSGVECANFSGNSLSLILSPLLRREESEFAATRC